MQSLLPPFLAQQIEVDWLRIHNRYINKILRWNLKKLNIRTNNALAQINTQLDKIIGKRY